ncbi:hypothetical protein VTL71DRAFT_9429 [Oculimacula yallundae]|uniref:DUF6606 domain-containing protein n=1 Tax=Oculimacula yallundae TaxID=86028 RepID=A0ABR4BRW1_9HELO
MATKYLITHCFLPPQLPQKDDSSMGNDYLLTKLFQETLSAAVALASPDTGWKALTSMADLLLEQQGTLTEARLVHSMGSMQSGGMLSISSISTVLISFLGVLVLHIRAQNAGLMIRREEEAYVFESFELSPTTDQVTTTKGRLLRCFPGPAIAVNRERVDDMSFRRVFAQFVLQLNDQVLEDACAKSQKARSTFAEVRQTASPQYVTELLTAFLRSIGQPHDVTRIQKHTRDDVLWHEALTPWRRSPRWLLLRVALQTSLKKKDEDQGRSTQYKMFMVLLLTNILNRALQESTSGELLFIMMAKISRRMLKLGSVADDMPWLDDVKLSMDAAQKELRTRWNIIQNTPHTAIDESADLQGLRQSSDIHLQFRTLRTYLEEINQRLLNVSSIRPSLPICKDRILQDASILPTATTTGASSLWLLDLEAWVKDHLQTWTSLTLVQTPSTTTCKNLATLMSLYFGAARELYKDDPQSFSIMVLTIMDMWVSLDKCTVSAEPLFKKYPTGFPFSLFDRLLLAKKQDLSRLFYIEQYLLLRRDESEPGYPPIFLEGNTARSFAVVFFEQSPKHQQLKLEIEATAATDRERKLQEFAKKKVEYENLLSQANAKTCSTTPVAVGGRRNRRIVQQHLAYQCSKCSLKSDAANMKITAHEWPLPSGDAEAKAAVFELEVPDIVSIYVRLQGRESTYAVLVDLFGADTAKSSYSNDKYMLLKSEGIKRWIKTKPGRIQLASSVKEVARSHYGKQGINTATKSTVCVENGLRCIMYDSSAGVWTHEILGKHSLGRTCTLKLPPGDYRSLQYVVDDSQHSSNSTLARQDECPGSTTLHELYSFSTLRAGHRLQWRNIARELVSRVLNFNHNETHLLMMQAAYEAGPSGQSFPRDSHVDLVEEDFGLSLISAIEDGLGSVESNWQGATAVRTFTTLTTRLLSLSPHMTVHRRCFKFLDRARKVLLEWIRDVTALLHTSDGEEGQKKFAARILDLALSCHATFDIDECHLASIFPSPQNVSIAIECAVTVYDRCPPANEGRDASMAARMAQFVRCSRSIESTLREQILTGGSGIDIAIDRLWSGYEPSGKWTAMSSPYERWVYTQISAQGNRAGMTVHFNVLDGDFLVNGVPLTRLPRPYESHATYQRIFGGRILEVVPSQMVGMTFASRRDICGYQVHFHLHGSELIIRACKDGSDLELLPLRALDGDIPHAFIEDYAHWFDHESGSIELRPIGTPWNTSPTHWRTETLGSQSFVLSQSSRKLMEMRSRAVQAIHCILSTLEAAEHIHVMLTETSTIEVHIPRMNLDFTIAQESSFLESKQFRGMVVDRIQTFGSLTGLVTRLVLRETIGSSRMVLVPDGHVHTAKQDDHVRVHIDTGSERHISYHPFQIDSLLGRLVDNGSLHSRLFRAYLHAVTSYPLSDNLLGRTGTEEALGSLTQASTASFSTFGESETRLLDIIGSLSPIRTYYPSHLKTMENVRWSRFPSLQQHEKFFQIVESMKQNALSLQELQEVFVEAPKLNPRKFMDLYERASIRLSNIRVDGYGGENFTTQHDRVYAARDGIEDSTRELRACSVARQVDSWTANSIAIRGLLSKFERWGSPFSGKNNQSFQGLGFDRTLLDPASTFLPAAWNTIQKMLTECTVSKDRYRVMLFLLTLAYSPNPDPDIVQVLLAFATNKQLATVRMPLCNSIDLSHGYTPITATLMKILGRNIKPFQNSSESRFPPLEGETSMETVIRREDAFNAAADEKCEQFIQTLTSQWPASNLDWTTTTVSGLETYVNTNGAKREILEMFQMWHVNHQFREYVAKLEAILCTMTGSRSDTTAYSFQSPVYARSVDQRYISFENIIIGCNPSTVVAETHSPLRASAEKTSSVATMSHRSVKLQKLLSRLSEKACDVYEKVYITDLQKSFAAFTIDHDH